MPDERLPVGFWPLVDVACTGIFDDAARRQLQAMLRESEVARRTYLEYCRLHSELRFALGTQRASKAVLAQTESAQTELPQRGSVHNEKKPLFPSPASPVPGFLRRITRVSGESSLATALMWMVMAVLCSGMVLTIFFCVLLVYRGVGVNVHVDALQVAKGGEQGARSGEQMPEIGDHKSEVGDPTSDHRLPTIDFRPLTSSPSPTVARLVQAYDCRWAIGSHSPRAGDDLEPGRKLVLTSGLAEIMFESGVRAVLQGPAAMEIGSKTKTFLSCGKLTVRVEDPDARGFEVDAPGMKYTDLGTEFGLSVAQDGSQEMHVFRGRVQAEVAPGLPTSLLGRRSTGEGDSNPSSLIPQPSPLILSANQAIRVASPAGPHKPFERFPANKKRFCRVLTERAAFGLFSTGVGLDRGAADPHWQITRVSTNAAFKPQSAAVADPLECYAHDNRDKAQWISTSKELAIMPCGCRWTFRTHFDLTGFDPATARIEGRFAVDDFIAEIRLNGKTVSLPAGAREDALFSKWLECGIEGGFAAGDNTLEIVIENTSSDTFPDGSKMAFCFDCKGTARPLLTPAAED